MGFHVSRLPGEQRAGPRGRAHDHDAGRPLRRGPGRRLLARHRRRPHRRVHGAGRRERRGAAVLVPRAGAGLRGQLADAVHHRRRAGRQHREHPVRRHHQPQDRDQVVRLHRPSRADAGVPAAGVLHAAQRASRSGGAGGAQRGRHLRRDRGPVPPRARVPVGAGPVGRRAGHRPAAGRVQPADLRRRGRDLRGGVCRSWWRWRRC